MNAKCKEVEEAIQSFETASDRPDIIARVFELKSKQMADDIYNKGVFGHSICHVHTMEWQKRSLPHKHMLVTVNSEWKLRTPDDVDSCISAIIPDQVILIYIVYISVKNIKYTFVGKNTPTI